VFNRFVVFIAVAGSIAIMFKAVILGNPADWVAMDYRTFFAASRLPLAALYDGPNYQFIYPPTAIAPLRLFSLADYWPGFIALGLLSAGCFYAATRRLAGDKVALLSLLSLPALQGLLWGQIPMLLAAGLLGALSLRNDIAKGLAIGILAALKPQLFFMAPLIYLVRGEVRTVLMIGVGAVASVGASLLLFGLQPWRDWLAAIPHLQDFLFRNNAQLGMISLPGIALQFGVPGLPFLIAGLLVAAWLVARARRYSDPIALAAIIAGASIMASPYALIHDAIVLVPLAASCLLAARGIAAAVAVGIYAGTVLPFAVPAFLLLGPFRKPEAGDRP
jgi:hypothetical protein